VTVTMHGLTDGVRNLFFGFNGAKNVLPSLKIWKYFLSLLHMLLLDKWGLESCVLKQKCTWV